MTLPNFLIVGAAKAGTTSLYHYLAQHPQIYMSPNKEPRYFAPEYYTTFIHAARGNQRPEPMSRNEYESLFEGVTHEIAIGEASTEYLLFEHCAERIRRTIPDAKILIILRDPIERAYSAYCYQLRDGLEEFSFEEALQREDQRFQQRWRTGWFYKRAGYYYEQVNRYYQSFEHHNIKIILWKDLHQNTLDVCSEIFEFLGVNPNFMPDLTRANQSAIPRNQQLNRAFFQNRVVKERLKKLLPKLFYQIISRTLKQVFYSKKKPLNPETKNSLVLEYYDDILKLEDLTNLDLSHWKYQAAVDVRNWYSIESRTGQCLL